jgi:hypothetical protein
VVVTDIYMCSYSQAAKGATVTGTNMSTIKDKFAYLAIGVCHADLFVFGNSFWTKLASTHTARFTIIFIVAV